MSFSQFLLEDDDYTFGLLNSGALFSVSDHDQDDKHLGTAEIVRLTTPVEASALNTEIEVLWAA
ncbi:MAG: hypothetical protein V7746_22080 [Halioglobus sp.]